MNHRILHIPTISILLALAMNGPVACRNAASPKRVATTSAKVARTSHATTSPARRSAPINHFVFAKLKNPADADDLIADCDHELGGLPMIVAYSCGKPLDTGRGDRIDSNYDVGLYMSFASEADYTAYVEHPKHQALLAEWQPRWEWIRIQDVLDETP